MVPVVVVNSTLNALGVVRSLTRGHMPIFMVATTRSCPAAWTRSCHLVRFPSLNGRDLIDGLKDLAGRLGQRPVLILTSDGEVETVSAFREEIEPLFRLSLPSKEMVGTLADKTRFQTFAEREGFPVPRAVIVRDASELQLLKTLELPVVIKPGDKVMVLSGRVERAVRADTLDQARAVAARMLERANRLVVQEWIDGPTATSISPCSHATPKVGRPCFPAASWFAIRRRWVIRRSAWQLPRRPMSSGG